MSDRKRKLDDGHAIMLLTHSFSVFVCIVHDTMMLWCVADVYMEEKRHDDMVHVVRGSGQQHSIGRVWHAEDVT